MAICFGYCWSSLSVLRIIAGSYMLAISPSMNQYFAMLYNSFSVSNQQYGYMFRLLLVISKCAPYHCKFLYVSYKSFHESVLCYVVQFILCKQSTIWLYVSSIVGHI